MTLAKRAPHYSNSLSLRHSVFTLIAVAVLSANAKADEQKTKETEPELSPKEKEASKSTAPSAQSKKPRENYEPPRLKTQTLPLVPRRILDGEAGAVVLRLTIETNGAVGLAELHTPLLPDLDEFALEQAPLLKFAPAKVRGVPRRSIILFEWPFRETTPEPESSSPTNEATIHRKARVKTSSKGPRSRPSSRTHRAADADAELEVTVRGRSKVERLKRSPHAVDVLEMQTAQREAGDLGDRLNHSGAAIVRRSGGLGSRSALALNGLGGDRVRLFIDGVELKYAGYPFGAANVPVNLVDRIEIYQGVVPVNFGTDALGGVVHLVTSENVRDDRAMASLQIGSFDTIRASLSAQSYLPRAKSYARLNAFLDSSDNDYPIDVEVVDARGRLSPATVRRFHDSYRSIGGSFTVGTLSQPWANHAAITGFVNAHERDIQSDPTMSVPYGEVTFKKSGGGAHLRHTKRVGSRAQFETILGYSFTRTQFTDVATCRYGWRGDCLIDTGIAGEANQIPVDRTAQDHVAFAKLGARLQTKAGDRLNLSIAPTVAERRGDDAELSGEEYDPLRDPQSLQSGILGIEWVSDWLDDRLTTVIFAKSYGQHAYGKQANATAEVETLENSTFRVGAGASLRLFLTDTLFAKASYEHATRLPDPDEYFGDAGLIVRNLERSRDEPQRQPEPARRDARRHLRRFQHLRRRRTEKFPRSDHASQLRQLPQVRKPQQDERLVHQDGPRLASPEVLLHSSSGKLHRSTKSNRRRFSCRVHRRSHSQPALPPGLLRTETDSTEDRPCQRSG